MHKIFSYLRKNKYAYISIAPLIIGLLVFSYYPPIAGLTLSFFDKSSTKAQIFVGFDNYRTLFSDQIFLDSIPTMFKIMIPRLVIGIVVPLVMAELIFGIASDKSKGIYRVMILLPIVAPGVVGSLIWRNILSIDGLLSEIIKAFGASEGIDWLNDSDTVIFAIIFMGFPWIGGTGVLIYMSGLVNISTEVFEAAHLDGASVWQRIFKIDVPLLIGQIRYFVIFGIIGGLQDYGTQIILTQGGPGYATYVPGYYMYEMAFTHDKMGYASAIGSVLFVFIMAITLLLFKFINTTKIQGVE